MALRPFVEDLPPEALTLTFQAWSGQPVAKDQAARAALDVASFAAGKFFGGGEPLNIVGASNTPLLSEDVEAAFGAAAADLEIGKTEPRIMQGSPLLWMIIRRVAVELLSRL